MAEANRLKEAQKMRL